MLISKTPYRISFFGGGSDYPEWYKKFNGAFLSCTIDKYLYLSIKNLNSYADFKYRVIWAKIENTNRVEDIQHNVVREMLRNFRFKSGLEIYYQGDLPARSGMGSSSSFVVGLLNSFLTLKEKKISKINLAKKSIHFEQKILKETVGVQDQISAVYGGFNSVEINKKGNFKIKNFKIDNTLKNLNKNLMLVYTGINRTASEIAGKYVSKLYEKENIMKEIYSQVFEAEKLILNGKLDEFGKLLNESWKHKKSLSKIISNSKIDDLYDFSIKNGALGGKILGAGGGGFLLLYVPKKNYLTLEKKLKKYKNIKFNFSQEGSKIILNTENEKN